MNGIYIPNMKMPKRNATFLVHVNGDEIDFIPSCKYEEEFKEKRKTYKIVPIADMRPVVWGKWIWKKSGEVVCSKCNDLIAIVGNTEDLITVKSYHNFCPNCGADMREEN